VGIDRTNHLVLCIYLELCARFSRLILRLVYFLITDYISLHHETTRHIKIYHSHSLQLCTKLSSCYT